MTSTHVRELPELLNKTFDSVYTNGEDEVIFWNDNEAYKMCHMQDCCENVEIEEIHGDLEDLESFPLIEAEEVCQDDDHAVESGTWTFYKLGTLIGHVTIRWYGSSNGNYSENVDIVDITPK